jgi:putative flavoprotein involved in K+ transport
VLVVGAANSGLQIAEELSAGHRVTVAVGTKPPRLPQRLLGRDLFHWLTRLGLMTKPAESRLARRLRARGDAVIGTSTRDLRRRGVEFANRLTALEGRRAEFADGRSAHVDAVVWATGYRNDYSWLETPGAVVDGQIRHDRGVTDVPGLHVIGLPWQTSRGSALLGFVGRDAAEVAQRIDAASERADDPQRTPRLSLVH